MLYNDYRDTYEREREIREWRDQFNKEHNIPTVYFIRDGNGKLIKDPDQNPEHHKGWAR